MLPEQYRAGAVLHAMVLRQHAHSEPGNETDCL